MNLSQIRSLFQRKPWASWSKHSSADDPSADDLVKEPEPTQSMTDVQLRAALQIVFAYGHELRRKAGPWVSVPKIRCPVTSPGWGYVEGRTEALKVNKRLHLSEADDDYGFTEYCVLVDQVPALLLMFRGKRMSVSYIQEGLLFSSAGFPFTTMDEYKALPEPIRHILNDLLLHLKCVLEARPTDSVATVLSY